MWRLSPCCRYFCGEEYFCYDLPMDSSSLTRWRQRMGEENVMKLLRESPAIACRTGATKPSDFRGVVVDTTVQPKNISWPTYAKLIFKALGRLAGRAKTAKIKLRESFARSSLHALERCQAYEHKKITNLQANSWSSSGPS